MKQKLLYVAIIAIALIALYSFQKGNSEMLWTDQQLLQPADLAQMINNKSADIPVIFNIGPAGSIKGAIEIGATGEAENLAKLKTQLKSIPKNKPVVIYCGCCPFNHCPNIRPGFKLLTEMGYNNRMLLNLSHNLKMDWIDKGYPMN